MKIDNKLIETFIQLRTVVLALGETADPPWWRSKYLSETGLSFLERLFPRTAFSAALNSAGKAACTLHDAGVGRTGSYHLFRLPDVLEGKIRECLLGDAARSVIEELTSKLNNREDQLSLLSEISDGKEITGEGAVKIGEAGELTKKKTVQQIARLYLSAFRSNTKTYPYFEAANRD